MKSSLNPHFNTAVPVKITWSSIFVSHLQPPDYTNILDCVYGTSLFS